MVKRGLYGYVKVPLEIFKKLNPEFFIASCTAYTKYMNAKVKEIEHLENLGIDTSEVCCEWFKIDIYLEEFRYGQ